MRERVSTHSAKEENGGESLRVEGPPPIDVESKTVPGQVDLAAEV